MLFRLFFFLSLQLELGYFHFEFIELFEFFVEFDWNFHCWKLRILELLGLFNLNFVLFFCIKYFCIDV